MTKVAPGERLRMCACCRTMKKKNELFRAVLCGSDGIKLDLDLKIQGRGAYLCRNKQCIENGKKRKAIERSLSCKASPEIYDEMSDVLEKQS